MKFATVYSADDKRSEKFATVNNEDSMTQQSDKDEANINILMERYAQTGQIPQMLEPGKFGDFSEVVDFRGAQEAIRAANEAFAEVPAKIRKQFDNDPAQFYEFVNDPNNLDELRKMGLAAPLPETLPPQDNAPPPQETRYSDDGPIPEPSPQKSQNGNTSDTRQQPSSNQTARGASSPPRSR